MADLKETVRKAVEQGVDPDGFSPHLRDAWDEVQADARLDDPEPDTAEEEAPPAIDVTKLQSVEAVEAAIERNVEQDGSMEEHEQLLDRLYEIERNERNKPQPKPTTDAVVSGNDTLASLNERIAELQAEVGDAEAGDKFNERAELKELQDNVNQIGLRIPYVGSNTEELGQLERAATIRHEELKREAKNWDDSPAKAADLKEQADQAIREAVLMRRELRTREELRVAREARGTQREREAIARATRQWHEAWDGEIARIEAFYPSPYVALGDPATRPERWELERARAEREKPPRESLVAWHRAALEREGKDAGVSDLYPAANLVVEGES